MNTVLVSGILTVVNLHKLADVQTHTLNISVSDGVYTSFCRVRVEMVSSNQHSPSLEQHQYDVKVTENQPPGRLVARVSASDPDSGIYGQISYSIPSQLLQQMFSINNLTGHFSKLHMKEKLCYKKKRSRSDSCAERRT